MRQHPTTRFAAVIAAAVLLGGCQSIIDAVDGASVNDRDDLRDDFVATGLETEEADCMLAELDRQLVDLEGAIDASGGSREQFEADNAAAFRAAFRDCVDLSDLGGSDLEAFRQGFIEGMVEDPTFDVDEKQAVCVYDELLARGVKPQAMAGDGGALAAEIPGAMEACGVVAPEIGDLSETELRRAFTIGFAETADVTQTQAECVYDSMVDQGVPPLDFAGETLSPQAERVLPDVLDACDVQL